MKEMEEKKEQKEQTEEQKAMEAEISEEQTDAETEAAEEQTDAEAEPSEEQTDVETEASDEAEYQERRRQRQARLQAVLRRRRRRKLVFGAAVVLALVLSGYGYYYNTRLAQDRTIQNTDDKDGQQSIAASGGGNASDTEGADDGAGTEDTADTDDTGTEDTAGTDDTGTEDTAGTDGDIGKDEDSKSDISDAEDGKGSNGDEVLAQANLLASQYNYDKAIELLKSQKDYDTTSKYQEAAAGFEEAKAACVSWPLEEVTHVFYHILVKDPSKAFDGDYKSDGYNQVMTTIDEFNKITQSMYDKGYVMVSIKDMMTANEDGTMTRGEILLPPGKIPFVLSQDDVCYYHYMDGDGYASRLIVDEEGKVRNEYVEDDGSISVGDYDMVPLIDRFVEEHPDFSYRGAKGIVALTGYNGILGYRTDISYETRPDDLDEIKVKWLDAHPDFDLEKEREGAKKVADAMKANGWEFASHTWGHQNVGEISMEKLQADTQKFKENVDPLIGGTDIIIFAFGTDLTQVEDYSGDKFEYLKGQGYNYYCNVDSTQYFVQLRDRYFRQGRRNLDGYRMYYNPEMVEDLFDASAVFDPSRPTPVPPM